jgi:hypothetical protein
MKKSEAKITAEDIVGWIVEPMGGEHQRVVGAALRSGSHFMFVDNDAATVDAVLEMGGLYRSAGRAGDVVLLHPTDELA